MAAVLHIILFSAFAEDDITDTGKEASVTGEESAEITIVSEGAVKAAIDFILVSCQQTAFCAGRGTLEELLKFSTSSVSNQLPTNFCPWGHKFTNSNQLTFIHCRYTVQPSSENFIPLPSS